MPHSSKNDQQLIAELERKNRELQKMAGRAKQNQQAISDQAQLILQQKQFSEAVLNSSREAIISINTRGLITLFNTSAEEIFGYSSDEVYLKNIKMLMPSPFKEAHDSFLERYLQSGEKKIIGIGRDVLGQKKDGATFPISLRVVEIKTESHHEFVGFIKDLSKLRQVERQVRESDRRYRAIVEDQTDLICRYTVDFILTFVNQAYCRHFGVEAQAVIGASILDLLPIDVVNWFIKAHAALSRDKPIMIHEDKIIHNGKQEWQHWSTRAIFSEDKREILEFQGVGSVVTDRKQAELNALLARKAADKANLAKSQFLSSMSHELRTPLNSIIGFSQLLELDEEEPLTESQKDSVLQINKAGNHLLKLINEILDLSTIESGQITLINEVFDIKNICLDALAIVETLADKKGITVSLHCEENKYWVNADYMRSKQIFLNILSNAIKYNRQQGRIDVEVVQQGDFIVINFADTGIGISSENLADLFQPFNRLGYEASAIEGTGIGLSLTKQLVEKMGGEIGVSSQVGVGSTFWVKLPVSGEQKHKNAHSVVKSSDSFFKENPPSGQRYKILYIEDNTANMELMRNVIKQMGGFSMIEANNAEMGIDLFERIAPDLVLMDIDLPGMNGFEALAEIKSRFPQSTTPIIAVSSNAMQKQVIKGRKGGFYDYITKPFDAVSLVEVIRRALTS